MRLMDVIADRLKEKVPALNGRVENLLTLAAIKETKGNLPIVTPVAYVIPEGERAGDVMNVTGPVRQPSTDAYSILLYHYVANDTKKARISDALRPIIDDTIKALQGWQPPIADLPLSFKASRLDGVSRGGIWWEIRFEIERLIISNN